MSQHNEMSHTQRTTLHKYKQSQCTNILTVTIWANKTRWRFAIKSVWTHTERKRQPWPGCYSKKNTIWYYFIFLLSHSTPSTQEKASDDVCACVCHTVVQAQACQFLVLTLRFILRYWAAGRYKNLQGEWTHTYTHTLSTHTDKKDMHAEITQSVGRVCQISFTQRQSGFSQPQFRSPLTNTHTHTHYYKCCKTTEHDIKTGKGLPISVAKGLKHTHALFHAVFH